LRFEQTVNCLGKKGPADPVEPAQQGFRRLARLATETTADGAGQGLLQGDFAALGTASRRQMKSAWCSGQKLEPGRRGAPHGVGA
jgi:hypothetical protein